MEEYFDIFGKTYRIPYSESSFWIQKNLLFEFVEFCNDKNKIYENIKLKEINDFHDRWSMYQLETF